MGSGKAKDMRPSKDDEIKDEPGAEERFLRGVRKTLKTPPKPFTKPAKAKATEGKAGK